MAAADRHAEQVEAELVKRQRAADFDRAHPEFRDGPPPSQWPALLSEASEQWRDVRGYEGRYQVSSLGRVRSLERPRSADPRRPGGVRERIMSSRPNHGGYLYVCLSKNGVKKNGFIHSMVALAFLGDRPEGMQICHRDGDRTNNTPSNLRYDSCAGNLADRYMHGTAPVGSRNSNAMLDEKAVAQILSDERKYRVIAEAHGVAYATVKDIKQRRRWKHVAPLIVKESDK